MKYHLAKFIIFFLAFMTVTTSCNDDSEDSGEPLASSSTVVVSSFALSKDTKILPGLDSVYFSIDLKNAQVFNADSLPYGTNVSRLVPVIGTQGCSVAELHFRSVRGNDTIVNYLTNSTDSVNFANGPVKLHLVAMDGVTERDYQLKVNVHQMKPDSLYWNRSARRALPSLFEIPNEQKTVKVANHGYVCFTRNNGYCVAWATNPADEWAMTNVETGATFPQNIDLTTIVAGDDVLYALDENGNLLKSVNSGSTTNIGTVWTSTGSRMDYLYGSFGNKALGCVKDGSNYYFVTYPDGERQALPSGLPVRGTSEMILLDSKWSATPQMLMAGGCLADGSLTGAVWGYDGRNWAQVSRNDVPAGEDKTMFLYTTFATDSTNWSVKEYPTIFIMGGRNAEGIADGTVYLSRNMGINWKKGDALVQLPSYVPAMSGVQAFVDEVTEYVSRSCGDEWSELRGTTLPPWWAIDGGYIQSRATAPITQWDAPFVYLFGGYNQYGALYNTVWRGVINRLTFKPLQ